MKQLVIALSIVVFASCSGTGDERTEQKTDNSSGAPATIPTTDTNPMDTSTQGVQDSTTTMGYDTGAVRKN